MLVYVGRGLSPRDGVTWHSQGMQDAGLRAQVAGAAVLHGVDVVARGKAGVAAGLCSAECGCLGWGKVRAGCWELVTLASVGGEDVRVAMEGVGGVLWVSSLFGNGYDPGSSACAASFTLRDWCPGVQTIVFLRL